MKSSLSNPGLDAFISRVVDVAGDAPGVSSAGSLDEVAESWKRAGLRAGDLVLLSLPNGKELLHQFFGVLLAEGVPALVAPMTPAARLCEMSRMMGARAIGALRLPAGQLGADRVEIIGPMKVAMFRPTSPPAARAGEVLLLTSGTSGFASGCVFDFDSLLLNAERHVDAIGQRSEDVVLVNLPLYFSFALVAQALGSLVRSSRLVIGGPPFHVPAYQQVIRDFSVTVSSITPVLAHKLLESDARFLNALRVLSIGGAALKPESVEHLLKCRPAGELYITYGLTQAGPRVSTLAAHHEPRPRYGSVGLPLPGTGVCLKDAGDGSGLKQLYVSSATVMKRSIGLVEGWPHRNQVEAGAIATGDVFEQDEQGYLYFQGRLGDFIDRRGEKINLAAVRRVAASLPNVVRAKTVTFRHHDEMEEYDLELQLDPSADLTLDRGRLLRAFLRRAEMPRHVRVVTATKGIAYSYK